MQKSEETQSIADTFRDYQMYCGSLKITLTTPDNPKSYKSNIFKLNRNERTKITNLNPK